LVLQLAHNQSSVRVRISLPLLTRSPPPERFQAKREKAESDEVRQDRGTTWI